MAFKIKTPAEIDALAARTPTQKAVDEAKERFLRTVKGFASDREARRLASTQILVITLGDHPQASFGTQVKDHDGRVRATSSVEMAYREDGGAVTRENASEMRLARYWSSRTDREEHSASNGLDPSVGLDRMVQGGKVTLVGRETVIPSRDGGPDRVVFVATKAREGVHGWNDMMGVERDSLGDFVDRYVAMRPESYRESVAQLYAEKHVEAEEAKAVRSQEASSGRTPSATTGSKGPSDGPALQSHGREREGR